MLKPDAYSFLREDRCLFVALTDEDNPEERMYLLLTKNVIHQCRGTKVDIREVESNSSFTLVGAKIALIKMKRWVAAARAR